MLKILQDEHQGVDYSKFGWTIIGRVCHDHTDDDKPRITVNRISVQREEPGIIPAVNEVGDSTGLFATKIRRNDTTSPKQLQQTMQLDYNELLLFS